MKLIIKITYAVIVLITLSCIDSSRTTNETSYYSIRDKLKAEKLKSSLLEDLLISKSMITTSEKISSSFSFINFTGDTITLNDYVKKSKTLVLYVGSSFCSSCLEEELSMLSDFTSKHKGFEILVLARNISLRDLLVNKKKHNYKFNIGVIPSSYSINKSLEETEMPTYFLVKKTLKIINPYISQKKMLGLTKKYLQRMYFKEFK